MIQVSTTPKTTEIEAKKGIEIFLAHAKLADASDDTIARGFESLIRVLARFPHLFSTQTPDIISQLARSSLRLMNGSNQDSLKQSLSVLLWLLLIRDDGAICLLEILQTEDMSKMTSVPTQFTLIATFGNRVCELLAGHKQEERLDHHGGDFLVFLLQQFSASYTAISLLEQTLKESIQLKSVCRTSEIIDLIRKITESEAKNELCIIIMRHSTSFAKSVDDFAAIFEPRKENEQLQKALDLLYTSIDSNLRVLKSFLQPISKTESTQKFQGLLHDIESDNYMDTNVAQMITCLLEIVDQHKTLPYSKSTKLLTCLHRILFRLNILARDTSKRTNLLEEFNKLNSKVSMSVLFLSLNYLIQDRLSESGSTEPFPKVLTSKFKFLDRPPLPVSEFLYWKNPTDDTLTKANYNKLVSCLKLSLLLASKFLPEELYALYAMTDHNDVQVSEKLVLQLVELSIASNFAVLSFVQLSDLDYFYVDTAENIVCGMIDSVVNVDTEMSGQFLIWIHLIDFAHDLCFADLKCYPCFEFMFDKLIMLNSERSLFKLNLVASSLNTFASTFSDGDCQLPYLRNLLQLDLLSEMCVLRFSDFEFLYRTEAPKKKQQVSVTITDIKTRPNYVVNSARQQSVHVDDFKRESRD